MLAEPVYTKPQVNFVIIVTIVTFPSKKFSATSVRYARYGSMPNLWCVKVHATATFPLYSTYATHDSNKSIFNPKAITRYTWPPATVPALSQSLCTISDPVRMHCHTGGLSNMSRNNCGFRFVSLGSFFQPQLPRKAKTSSQVEFHCNQSGCDLHWQRLARTERPLEAHM